MYPDSEPALALAVNAGGELVAVSAAQQERDRGELVLTVDCGSDSRCPLDAGSPVTLAHPIAADGRLPIHYELKDFDLGTTTRTVEVRSPQLAAPITVTFNVSQRLSPAWIVVITLLGLIFGLLVRVILANTVSWAQRRTQILDLTKAIDDRRELFRHDTAFLATLNDISEVLKDHPTSEQVEAQRAAFTAAVVAAQKFWTDADATYRKNALSLTGAWDLPLDIESPAKEALAALDAEHRVVGRRDRTSYADAHAKSLEALDGLVSSCIDWLAEYRAGLDALSAASGTQPSDVLVGAMRSAVTWASALTAATPADAAAALGTVHRCLQHWADVVRPAVTRVVEELRPRGAALATTAVSALGSADPADASILAADALSKLSALPEPTTAGSRARSRAELEAVGGFASAPSTELRPPRLDAGPIAGAVLVATRFAVVGIRLGATLLQFIIVAVIATFALYWPTVATWVGTPDQIMSLFGTAFALNITVAAVVALFPSKAATPPAAPAAPAVT